jgi:CheY-like chemotaxis protein
MQETARILVIEDNPTNLELMVYLLQAFGYTPITAADGQAGLEAALCERPELIICDVHLPKLDGFGVVQRLKEGDETRRVPILAVTALAMVGDRDKILAAGFDGYIAKPIMPEEFVPQVEAFLPAQRRAASPFGGGTTRHE